VSIGIGATAGTATPEELLAAADRAMYNAKRSGRNRVAVTRNGLPSRTIARPHPEMPVRTDGERRGSDRFELYGEPIVELSTGKTRRYELVVRVPGEDRRASSAAARTLRRSGGRLALVDEMDRFATRKAIRLLGVGRTGDAPLYVNVCGGSFAKRDILESLTDLRARPHEAERLTFLIPEVAAVADAEAVHEFMLAVQDIGCRVALGDFGRGFGSFACLKHLPVQEVKIHGSLVSGMLRSPSDRLIVKALVEVARGMDIEPIAQRITGRDVACLLEEYGVRLGQGSYLGEAGLLKTTRRRQRPRPTLVTSRRRDRAPSKTDT
jgi:EAL domain-containing protein (putative c-di-GMP-specific phosphodiesterase class I)